VAADRINNLHKMHAGKAPIKKLSLILKNIMYVSTLIVPYIHVTLASNYILYGDTGVCLK